LKHIASHSDDVWITTGQEIAEFFRESYWDQSMADIQGRGVARGGTGFAPA
jgi:allantoinase